MHDLEVDHRDEVIMRLKQAVEALLKHVPDTDETKPRKEYAASCLADKMVSDAQIRFLKLKDDAKHVSYRQLLTTTSIKLRRIVQGTLASTINAHGPITSNLVPSATKRISNQLSASMIIKVSDSGGLNERSEDGNQAGSVC